MRKPDNHNNHHENKSGRRLSPWRVMLLVFVIVALIASGASRISLWQVKRSTGGKSPWFASYVDVTATPTFAFDKMGEASRSDVILSFIVSLSSESCAPSWGSVYTLDKASTSIDLDRRIARLQKEGGNVAISFGGKNNKELAVSCTDLGKLFGAYKTVVDRYGIDTIDLDLEETGLTDKSAVDRRAEAIAKLQSEKRDKGKSLAVWVTLPVTPEGLSEDGTNAIASLITKKVDIAGVNAMTMDYGKSKISGQTMLAASESALIQVHRQLGVLYKRYGKIYLNSATLWSKIGATPMIGQNDFADEIFTLGDAKGLNEFAVSRGLRRMSMWSANRDLACGSNYANTRIVSDSCSGITQDKYAFIEVLGKNFTGSFSNNSILVTTADEDSTEQKLDDPASSPYQIWSESGTYLKDTKVVWHHNVYKAKWWTRGDIPDNAVLQSWETPWEFIGPVLPGEKPVPPFTLPSGTYPDWSGTAIYNADQRVLFNNVPYQAKWWNQGESPAASSSDPNSSPWMPLTQEQIEKSR